MGRIRSIKPELPHSEQIGRVSREARLLFVLLFTICDDAGRARAAPQMLASLLFPFDEASPKPMRTLVEEWLSELDEVQLIRRYEVAGSQYLEVINWLKHQKIDKPTPSKLPPFVEGSANTRRGLALGREGIGVEGRGVDQERTPREGSANAREGSPKNVRGTRLSVNWMPGREGAAFARSHGLTGDEANRELEKFTNYWSAKAGRGATKVDWDATWRSWILNAIERRPRRGPQQPSAGERAERLADEVRAEEHSRGVR